MTGTGEKRTAHTPVPDDAAGAPPGAGQRSGKLGRADTDAASAPLAGDIRIVERIASVVHPPFREVWRRYEEDVWAPLLSTLNTCARVHERALSELPRMRDALPTGEVSATDVRDALDRYRQTVADDVVGPLHAVFGVGEAGPAVSLERALARAAQVRSSLSGLPVTVEAPISRTRPARPSGTGAIRTAKRFMGRVLGSLGFRCRVRIVPVARLARQHLDQVVLRQQKRAFLESQRRRAQWLGRIERALSEWVDTVLSLPVDGSTGAARLWNKEAVECSVAGGALQEALDGLLQDMPQASGRAHGTDFAFALEHLFASVAVAGTLAADPPSSRPPPRRPQRPATRWDAWAGETADRLALYQGLIVMHGRADAIRRRLLRGWERSVEQVDATFTELDALLRQSRDRAERLSADEAADVLHGALDEERLRIGRELTRLEDTLPDSDDLTRTLDAEGAVNALGVVGEGMPRRLVLHDILEPGASLRTPAAELRSVHLPEVALRAFDTLRRERIRETPAPIREAMSRARLECTELREVSVYGYEAAIAELQDAAGAARPLAPVRNGLGRAIDKAGRARAELSDALARAETRATLEFEEGWRELMEGVTADRRVTEGYRKTRSYLAVHWSRWRKRGGAWLRNTGAPAVRRFRSLPMRTRRIVAQAGVTPSGLTLAQAEKLPDDLPVVYRRLFALRSLTDPRLLAGREEAMETVLAGWADWTSGHRRSLFVVAFPGSGVTSFLNIAALRLAGHGDAATLRRPPGERYPFRTRICDEAELASRLSGRLGLGEAGNLDELANRVLEAPEETLPPYVILERAEHLHLRVPGGSTLLKAFLTLMARTESKVFWIVAITAPAWQLVKKRLPGYLRDVERVVLRELSADQLHQAILARHRLSGLPLRFAALHDGQAFLRRRFYSARKYAQLAETDYFQRLQRAAMGSVRLALFYWLRSADFTTREGGLLAQPLKPLAFALSALDPSRNFALKAMLDHGTLTVAEYCDVARISVSESRHLFRSLEASRMIEKVRGTARYRIRPLMIGPVSAHLRSHNILH